MLDKNKVEELSKTKEEGMDICGVCYKQFVRNRSSIYKVAYKGKTFHMCSYTCYGRAKDKKARDSKR